MCDGYGYSSSTLFHHVNTGWGGDDDIWYALPEINTTDGNGDYNMVEACIYNIYTNGSGQIISGRVTDPAGAPVAGATVTAQRNGGGTYTAMTDTNGIYALAGIPKASTCALTVNNAGESSATGNYSTGTSVYNKLPSGNVWGANFVLSPPLLAIPETGFASIGPVGGPFSVLSQNYTLTNTSASAINWTLSNTNNWLSVTSTNGTLAAGAFTSLTISLNSTAGSLRRRDLFRLNLDHQSDHRPRAAIAIFPLRENSGLSDCGDGLQFGCGGREHGRWRQHSQLCRYFRSRLILSLASRPCLLLRSRT